VNAAFFLSLQGKFCKVRAEIARSSQKKQVDRKIRLQGLAFLVTFWAMPKSDKPIHCGKSHKYCENIMN
jgi:hypothetical protein